jgi:hypothetical protein
VALGVSLFFGWFYAFIFVVSESWFAAVPMVLFVGWWLLWVQEPIRARAQGWISLSLMALMLSGVSLGAFAGTSAILLKQGIGTAQPRIVNGKVDFVRGNYEYATAAYEHYLWHFADTIPLLKVTETTNWRLDHPIKRGPHGVLTLAAKIVLILPFVSIAALALAEWKARTFGSAGDRESAEKPPYGATGRTSPSDEERDV